MIGRTNAVIGKGGGKYPSADDVQVTYTGTMETPREIQDAAGNKYKLYVLTGSGTLTVSQPCLMDICLVQGGGNGTCSAYRGEVEGGSGGRMVTAGSVYVANTAECVVGSRGGGSTSVEIDDIVSIESKFISTSTAGTGGGSTRSSTGIGDGKTKYVFGDTSVYDYPICAGGGSGSLAINSGQNGDLMTFYLGGNGGTNGGDGGAYKDYTDEEIASLTGYAPIVEGGYNGGGRAARAKPSDYDATVEAPTDATTYGSGGGGGSMWKFDSDSSRYRYYDDIQGNKFFGYGYQGAIFIRILK